jgi:hypothetical protein
LAKATLDRDLFDNLRARGLRKRAARLLAQSPGADGASKAARQALQDLRTAASELEDRLSGGPQKRSQTAAKAARTRQRNAAKRSQAARKAARTRAAARK